MVMEKSCPEHGEFRDIVYSDARLYLKMEEWTFGDNRGLSKIPPVSTATRCPDDCGLCNLHTSHTGLANIDLTNRCNLTCPVCFANANAAGYVYEPRFRDRSASMLQALRDERPVAGRIVQFSGGEPTIYPRFFDVLRMAREMGFSHTPGGHQRDRDSPTWNSPSRPRRPACTRCTCNSTASATTSTGARAASRCGSRSCSAIENVRKAGLKIVFVPTIVKGLNDHQIGDIIRLALENIDCTSGISFQPVAFTGRIARRELEAKRFTLSDFAHAVQEQTGIADPYEDWFPLSCVTPFSKLLARPARRGNHHPELPSALLAGHVPVRGPEPARAVPVTRFVDVGPCCRRWTRWRARPASAASSSSPKFEAWNSLRKFFHAGARARRADLSRSSCRPCRA